MRTHLVLVPGFGGFDALGTLRYYAGVTPIFRVWQKSRDDVALHYFDNLPTAAVATRAKALRLFLAKRFARGEFARADRIALVGHSTGGLDVRRLLLDLESSKDVVDGCEVSGAQLLERISRLAFMSVPQRGTNIADWVRDNGWIENLVWVARMAIGWDVEPSLVLEPALSLYGLLRASAPDILVAARDVESEIGERRSPDAFVAARGRQTFSDVKLWIENVDGDFMAIDDLLATRPDHSVELSRAVAVMKNFGITAQSYATVGSSPFPDAALRTYAESQEPSILRTLQLVAQRSAEVDVTYAMGYAACANGPFIAPDTSARWFEERAPEGLPERFTPSSADNDGVVNTASMLCHELPGPAPLLVRADHGDIIGHFALDPEPKPGRMRARYDLLRSASGFGPADFVRVWRSVFDYVAG